MDVLTPEQRHKNMQHIRSRDTKIEVILRKALWHKGIRYRKNYKMLLGTPDIVITKYKIAIFCDGEFFHGRDWTEQKKRLSKGNNPEFWIAKIERNIKRDKRITSALESYGWKVIRFWGDDIKKKTDDCVKMIIDAVEERKNMKSGVYSENINSAGLIAAENTPDYGRSAGAIRKTVYVVAAVIIRPDKNGVKRLFAAQRGYGQFKDYWEFPGGKEEQGETPQEALIREIKEELDTDISVDKFLDIIEYDYPDFHLSMECYLCSIVSGKLKLLEHEKSKWLSSDELESVEWLPADVSILGKIRKLLKNE